MGVILLLAGGIGSGMAQMPGMGTPQPQEEQYPHPETFEELPPLGEPMAWWVIALMGLGGLLVLALLVWLILRDRPPRPVVKPHALKTAMRKLQKLKDQLDRLEPAEAAHQVSVILREFLELKDDIPAPFRTSEELYDAEKGVVQEELRKRFAPLAEVHDRLAFGPQLSRREDVKTLIEDSMKALQL